jgi:hypothetical protein
MSLEQLTGRQFDMYERRWSNVMLAAGAALLTAVIGGYFFRGLGTDMLVGCGSIAAVSVVVGLIAVARLRELERGWTESDRDERSDLHAALDGIDDH